jgi:hypothetical protein
VWVARILLTFVYTVSTVLGFFMLQRYVRPAPAEEEATGLFALLGLVAIQFARDSDCSDVMRAECVDELHQRHVRVEMT